MRVDRNAHGGITDIFVPLFDHRILIARESPYEALASKFFPGIGGEGSAWPSAC